MGSQEIALRLQEFWRNEGCPTVPPYGPIPSGALSPEVFFGVVAQQPWRSCQMVNVVDPSLAPYGDDPLRPIVDPCLRVTQQGSTSRLRERFVASLQMLGLDLRVRDVRFVPRAQSHSSLSVVLWRVLIDGIDVGSLSRLYALAGVGLKEVAMRAEYSLHRLAVCVEGLVKDKPTERGRQISSYYLEVVDPERISSLSHLCADECEQALASGLYFPAYEHVLTLSYLHLLTGLRGVSDSAERSKQAAHITGLTRGCVVACMEATNV